MLNYNVYCMEPVLILKHGQGRKNKALVKAISRKKAKVQYLLLGESLPLYCLSKLTRDI